MITKPLFGPWDYVILTIVLCISASIGVYYRFTGGKQKTMQEYLLADKNMPIFPVAFSLMASFMSAITLLGVSSENYTYGLQFIVINLSYGIATPIAAYLFLPYLERRFGKTSRLAASLSYTLQMTLYMGVVLYAPALALEALTGISQLAAILSVGLVCTFYSTIGGMKAVLMTDVFQSILMFVAVFSVIICALVDKGSFEEIWRIASEGKRTSLWNSTKSALVELAHFVTIEFEYIVRGPCDLMPYYVVDSMGHIPGLSGLFVAGIFSASLSTVSAALNSLAAITVEDYFKPLYKAIFKTPLPESKGGVITKVISLSYGFICLAVAFLAKYLGSILQASLTIFGVIGGPLLGLFSLGMFTTTANEEGAVFGLTSAIVLSLWMAFGNHPPPETLPRTTEGCDILSRAYTNQSSEVPSGGESDYFWLYRVSYLYNGVLGLVSSIIIGYIASILIDKCLKRQKRTYDPNLFIPPLERRMRKKLEQQGNLNLTDLSGSSDNLKNGVKTIRQY
nr:unnamed protein product [Callosobruchus chinensis]